MPTPPTSGSSYQKLLAAIRREITTGLKAAEGRFLNQELPDKHLAVRADY